MLDEKRIKEAETSIKGYLDDGLIWKFKTYRNEIMQTYQRNYQESIDVAQKI